MDPEPTSIIPNGNILLIIKTNDATAAQSLLVSSDHLIPSSPFFRRLLSNNHNSNFAEAAAFQHHVKSSRFNDPFRLVIDLSDLPLAPADRVFDACETVLRLLHASESALKTSCHVDDLYDVSVVAEYFRCGGSEALKCGLGKMFPALKPSRDDDEDEDDDDAEGIESERPRLGRWFRPFRRSKKELDQQLAEIFKDGNHDGSMAADMDKLMCIAISLRLKDLFKVLTRHCILYGVIEADERRVYVTRLEKKGRALVIKEKHLLELAPAWAISKPPSGMC